MAKQGRNSVGKTYSIGFNPGSRFESALLRLLFGAYYMLGAATTLQRRFK